MKDLISKRKLLYEIKSFTLLEMIVSLAILSLLLSLCFIQSNAWVKTIEKYNLKTQSREILQSLLVHKNHGLLEGSTKKVYIFEDKLYIQTISDEVTTQKIVLRDGIKVSSNTYYGKSLILKPIGTVNYGGHITFKSKGGENMTIVIQLGTGRIYLKEGSF